MMQPANLIKKNAHKSHTKAVFRVLAVLCVLRVICNLHIPRAPETFNSVPGYHLIYSVFNQLRTVDTGVLSGILLEMRITLYRRHTKACTHQADKAYQRCDCPVWFEANVIGRRWNTDTETWVQTANESMQSRWSSKEKNWRSAEHKARQLEQQLDDILTGKSRPDVKTVQ